jgi:hypothetical protein
MTKFRIVEVIEKSGSPDRKSHWIIEQKKLFGWKEIGQDEGPRYKNIIHKSYEDAELYLLDNYTAYGVCRKYGNVYTYNSYTYYM